MGAASAGELLEARDEAVLAAVLGEEAVEVGAPLDLAAGDARRVAHPGQPLRGSVVVLRLAGVDDAFCLSLPHVDHPGGMGGDSSVGYLRGQPVVVGVRVGDGDRFSD